ncbi:1623_t:CDS:2 [Cetraspora pellucida]|uniref:1623_t:CDS:1 n=1 Tax=Cetraspora pellucida TaxID=1433469 RepID=A0A9N9N7H3_9GLOM|nr:1623_t:CDS:2 [Cetraspora pellucida]
MTCEYLSIQPSSVASERTISRAGFMITYNRANLSENTLLESQNELGSLYALPGTK